MRSMLAAVAVVSLLATAVSADATPCRNAKGKFVKCPLAAAVAPAKPVRCRDAKGHFAKCGTPGAK